MKSFHVVVTGDVQKGNFLNWIHDHAVNLKLSGWVRNLDDKRVEVLAQGEQQSADALKDLLKQGSPFTGLNEIKASWMDYEKTYDKFEIRS